MKAYKRPDAYVFVGDEGRHERRQRLITLLIGIAFVAATFTLLIVKLLR